jgi:hypothetical protein
VNALGYQVEITRPPLTLTTPAGQELWPGKSVPDATAHCPAAPVVPFARPGLACRSDDEKV